MTTTDDWPNEMLHLILELSRNLSAPTTILSTKLYGSAIDLKTWVCGHNFDSSGQPLRHVSVPSRWTATLDQMLSDEKVLEVRAVQVLASMEWW